MCQKMYMYVAVIIVTLQSLIEYCCLKWIKGILCDRQWKSAPLSGFYHIDADLLLQKCNFKTIICSSVWMKTQIKFL